MKSYPLKENRIGSVVNEILRYRRTEILLLLCKVLLLIWFQLLACKYYFWRDLELGIYMNDWISVKLNH